MRLLAIIQWHHFGFMVISLALLGYGASGTLIALARSFLLRHFERVYVSALALFGLGSVAAFLLAQKIPFNPEEMLWSVSHLPRLLALYLLLALPFLCAATCVGVALTRFGDRIPVLYAADLLGAGCGSLGLILALQALSPPVALQLIGVLGLAAAALACWELERRAWLRFLTPTLVLALLLPSSWLEPLLSPYKSLSQALQISGTRTVATHSGPLGLLTVVESETIPWRHAPGLSVNARSTIPEQLAVFTDGDVMTAITRFDGRLETLAYTDQFSSALPYHLAEPERVVVLRAGTGGGILQALFHGVPGIVAVESNPDLTGLLTGPYRDYSGALDQHPHVRLYRGGARGYFAAHGQQVDLIQLSLVGGPGGALQGISEGFDYTVEALGEYIDRLGPSGFLSLTGWVETPPRAGLKLLAAADRALQLGGVARPREHLLLIRGWQTFTLLVKKTPLTAEEIERARVFASARAFDVGYHPGVDGEDVNRYNVLARPYYFLAAEALLGKQRESFLESYKYDLRPATDDRPYFEHYFRWSALREMLALRGQGGLALLETAYLVLVATLVQALLAALALIAAPLVLLRRPAANGFRAGSGKPAILVYFVAIGLGYMLIEIAFMQTLSRLLDHPIYSAAVVLSSFLIFSGLGSLWAQRLTDPNGALASARIAVCALVACALVTGIALSQHSELLASSSFAVRAGVSVLALGPLAFCMGMPFPLGLARVAANRPALVPWAWGVNGCASVVGPVLALILALHLGLTAVLLVALGLYLMTLFVSP